MYGAMIGDYVGSIYEWYSLKSKMFPFFRDDCELTDDSMMTIAVASACTNWKKHHDLKRFQEDVKWEMHRIGQAYPDRGYGGNFYDWIFEDNPQPYNSYGNGSVMRVSPCGFVADSLEEAEDLARASALPTHNHPEGIKGAQATAAAIYLARSGHSDTQAAITGGIAEAFYGIPPWMKDRMDQVLDVSCKQTEKDIIQNYLQNVKKAAE